VRLWDTEKRKCIGVGKGHLGAIGSVAFSKKSKNFFISGSRFAFGLSVISYA
jgi:U3 small nucleolar RNA-associated protein 13